MRFVNEYSTADYAMADRAHAILRRGKELPSRAGATKELTFVSLTLQEPGRREILNPERKASLPAQIAETMWVLAGRDDIGWLSHYLPRAADFSDDGKRWRGAYGRRLRDWWGIDQLAEVVQLLKDDPTTRRAAMTIYGPTDAAAKDTKDIPCNNWLHFLARDGVLDLHVAVRSNDLIWGWSGINQFEWSALLEIVAGLTNLEMGRLHFSISSLHIYDRHWEKARRIAAAEPPKGLDDSPRFRFGGSLSDLDELVAEWFLMEEMIRNGKGSGAILSFPEPMLRSWLHVLDWWWNGTAIHGVLGGTRLEEAARLSPGHIKRPQQDTSFIDFVINLHTEKDAAYGDSWKRRGEMLGIMANIARKIDRLGVAGAGDTAADTAVDLFVYLSKYRHWLSEQEAHLCNPGLVTVHENRRLRDFYVTRGAQPPANHVLIAELKVAFDDLEKLVTAGNPNRTELVEEMARKAAQLAESLWRAEQTS